MRETDQEKIDRGFFYISGMMCIYGHDPVFRSSTNVCVACERERSRKQKKNLSEDQKARKKKYNSEYSKKRVLTQIEKEKIRKRERDRYSLLKIRFSEKNKSYRRSNPEKFAFYAAKSRRSKKNATPTWLSQEQMNEILSFYVHARDCFLVSGQPYHVDHIIPINGKNVCGLHVPWNLQILPDYLNMAKKNKTPMEYVICN